MVVLSYLLTSGINTINLLEPLKNASKIKITNIIFTTGTNNNLFMHVIINGFNQKTYQQNNYKYVVSVPLPNTSGSQVFYSPATDKPDIDLSKIERQNVYHTNQLIISFYINGVLTTDITALNPIYIELEIE